MDRVADTLRLSQDASISLHFLYDDHIDCSLALALSFPVLLVFTRLSLPLYRRHVHHNPDIHFSDRQTQ